MGLTRQSRVISINDLLSWRSLGPNGLIMSPKYQRNSVWNQSMKSYLIDSIIRGFPIPPIFIRQTIDPVLKQIYREVIDGQQRIRSILSYIDSDYIISKSHNKEYGNLLFDNLPTDVQTEFLAYELHVDLISESDDAKIYDMFARLNTNNVALNYQEVRNAKYWGEFKIFVYEYASNRARDFFIKYKILSEKQITRMADTELISSLIILLIDGIVSESPLILNKYYEKYNDRFELFEEIRQKLDIIFNNIELYYEFSGNNVVCFNRKTYFYTIFAFLIHQFYGLNALTDLGYIRISNYSLNNITINKEMLFERLSNFESEFDLNIGESHEKSSNYQMMVEFESLHRKRTTDKVERIRRIGLLNNFCEG